MIYSLSSKYAIRACIYLSQLPPGTNGMAKHIADTEGIPPSFLAKILQQLTRSGLLVSSKGPTGGYCLRLPSDKISLLALIDAVDGPSKLDRSQEGPLDYDTKAMRAWNELQMRIAEYLGQTTIADLAAAVDDTPANFPIRTGQGQGG